MGQLEQQEQAFVQQPGTIQVFLKVSGFLNEGLYQLGLGRIREGSICSFSTRFVQESLIVVG